MDRYAVLERMLLQIAAKRTDSEFEWSGAAVSLDFDYSNMGVYACALVVRKKLTEETAYEFYADLTVIHDLLSEFHRRRVSGFLRLLRELVTAK